MREEIETLENSLASGLLFPAHDANHVIYNLKVIASAVSSLCQTVLQPKFNNTKLIYLMLVLQVLLVLMAPLDDPKTTTTTYTVQQP